MTLQHLYEIVTPWIVISLFVLAIIGAGVDVWATRWPGDDGWL